MSRDPATKTPTTQTGKRVSDDTSRHADFCRDSQSVGRPCVCGLTDAILAIEAEKDKACAGRGHLAAADLAAMKAGAAETERARVLSWARSEYARIGKQVPLSEHRHGMRAALLNLINLLAPPKDTGHDSKE